MVLSAWMAVSLEIDDCRGWDSKSAIDEAEVAGRWMDGWEVWF